MTEDEKNGPRKIRTKNSVICVIVARNEQENIRQCINALKNQTYKLTRIVLIDDGSTDRTIDVARSAGVDEVRRSPYHHSESWLLNPKFALTHNFAIPEYYVQQYDYVLMVGGDHILDQDYVESCLCMMESNLDYGACSGIIRGEDAVSNHARGSGRLYRSSVMYIHALRFEEQFGWETLILLRMGKLGYKSSSFSFIQSSVLRKTGSNYSWKSEYYRGKFAKQINVSLTRIVLASCVLVYMRKDPKPLLRIFGHLSAKQGEIGDFRHIYHDGTVKDAVKKRLCRIVCR